MVHRTINLTLQRLKFNLLIQKKAKRQRANLEANLHILQCQTAVSAATTKAVRVETFNRLSQDLLDLPISPSKCTSEYL